MNPRLPCADCASCTLARDSWNGPVPMDGDKEPDIIFVGEAPGIEEVRAKKPFAGVSGKLLRGLVSYFNRVHEDRYGKRLRVAYTNVVACRPPGNRDPSTAEIEACSGRLRHELSQYPNARIVGLGRFAIKALGVRRELKEVDGCWIETHRGPVLASYHPAYILRQPGQFSAFKHGIGQAFEPEIRLLHMPKANYTIIECEADLKALKFEDDLVAVDIETTGFDHTGDRITCIGFSGWENSGVIVPGELVYTDWFNSWLTELFTSTKIKVVFHNGKFDIKFLIHQLGVPHPVNWFDTMLAHYAMNEQGLGNVTNRDRKDQRSKGHGLKLLGRKFLGVDDYAYKGNWKESENDKDTLFQYLANDVDITRKLAKLFMGMLDDRAWKVLNESLLPASEALTYIELTGIRFNLEYSRELQKNLQGQLEDLIAEFREFVGDDNFNPNSAHQVAQILYSKFGVPVQYHPKTSKPTTDANALRTIGKNVGIEFDDNNAVINSEAELEQLKANSDIARFILLMLRQRKLAKMDNTYCTGLIKRVINGRVYPSFNLHTVVTGRTSSDNPNGQNIPRKGNKDPITGLAVGKLIKDQFIADEGEILLSADYSQIELRVMALLSGEESMIEVYRNNGDIHTETTIAAIGIEAWERASDSERDELRTKIGKGLNFGLMYGMKEWKFAKDLGISVEEARTFINNYFASKPKVREFQERTAQEAFKRGYLITPFGRKRSIGFIPNNLKDRAHLHNHVLNFPIQSTASDCTLNALILITRALRRSNLRARPIMTVHDSIIFTVHPDCLQDTIYLVNDIMVNSPKSVLGDTVPFKADFEIGTAWGSLEKWKSN